MNYSQFNRLEEFNPSVTDEFFKHIGVKMTTVEMGVQNDPFPFANEKGELPKKPTQVRLLKIILERKNKKNVVLDWTYAKLDSTKTPSFYDIFASTVTSLEDFEWWCWSFGYNSNLISILNFYNNQKNIVEKINQFFTPKELAQIQKIV